MPLILTFLVGNTSHHVVTDYHKRTAFSPDDSSAQKNKIHCSRERKKFLGKVKYAPRLKVQTHFFLVLHHRVYGFLNCASSFVCFIACQNEREDCDLLIQKTGGGSKLKNYCKKWKNETSVKQCPETCNMCEYWLIIKMSNHYYFLNLLHIYYTTFTDLHRKNLLISCYITSLQLSLTKCYIALTVLHILYVH